MPKIYLVEYRYNTNLESDIFSVLVYADSEEDAKFKFYTKYSSNCFEVTEVIEPII